MSTPSALPAPLLTKQINLDYVVGPNEYGQGPASPTSGEDPSKAFDSNTGTKHLNPSGSKSGIEITYEDQTKLTSLSITTADKDPDRRLLFFTIPGASQKQRDPMAYALYGYTANGWQELSSGELNPPEDRKTKSGDIQLPDKLPYLQKYRITFPEVRIPGSAMQLSELNLSGLQIERGSFLPGNPTSIKGIDLDEQSQSRSPVNEEAKYAFDDSKSTKYLNFGGSNSGFELTYGLDTKITGFTITTANDSNDYPGRDPISHQLYGLKNDSWTLISSGDLLTPTVSSKEFYTKVDSPSYNQQYRLVFDKTRGAGQAMQLAEIKFYGEQQSAAPVSFYGLTDINYTTISTDFNGVENISGTGTWAGKDVQFTGKVANSGERKLIALEGSLELSNWLGNISHLKNHVNGTIKLVTTSSAEPRLAVEGISQVWLEPASAQRAQPFTAKLSDFKTDANGISSFAITPTNLSEPLQFSLGEAQLTAGSKALQYARSSDNALYTITFDGDAQLNIPEADPLAVSGQVLFGGNPSATGTAVVRPTSASFEIVNTKPYSIAGTEFRSIGGLKLAYQEDEQRRNGVLNLSGANSINLERLDDVAISLGTSGFDLQAAIKTASQTLAPTLWTLGSIDDRATEQSFDLGLVDIKDVNLGGITYLNRSAPASKDSVDLDRALVENLAGAGLFQVTPLYPTLQDTVTLYDLTGNAVSEVVLDISGAAETSALTTVKRSQQLSNQEKLTLFGKKKAADNKKEAEGVTTSYISDLFTSKNIQAEFKEFTDYFKAYGAGSSLNTAKYGSVSVDAKGQWTYTLDPSKLDDATKSALGNPTYLQVAPRINVATGLTAGLTDLNASVSALFAGVKSQAQMALKVLKPVRPFVETMEKELQLTGLKAIDNAILSLLEVVPDNAYKDNKLQLIELVDTASYISSKGKRATITPIFKQLGNTIRALDNLTKTSSSSGTASINNLDLGLLFRNDLQADDPYQWLYAANVNTANSQATFLGEIAKLAASTEALTELNEKGKKKKAKPNNKSVKGKLDKSVSASFNASVDVTIPALYKPAKFIADYLTEDLLTLFSLKATAGLELGGSIKIPTGIPLLSGMLGLDASLALSLSLISTLTSDDLEVLGKKIETIQSSVSDKTEQTKQIAALVGKAAKEGLGSDLTENSFEVNLEPYIGLALGVPNYNISGRLGVYFDYKLGTERQLVDSKGKVTGADDDVEQRIKFSDYFGNKPSGSYSYDPTLGSLRLDLDHNYDFLLARGSLDTSRYASFTEAYGHNSWLLNLELQPLNLRELIGDSTVSYDITLLAKLGDKLIDRIDWINIAGSSLVTPQGVDLFFADAKLLNSPASSALGDALRRQYPNLTDKERARLLSLIVDNAVPKRVLYALADSQAIDARINAMKNVATVRSASAINSAVAPTDRLRLRSEEKGQETAVDSFLYYGLAQAKYIDINPKLNTNYASVELDLISEGSDIELDLHFYDGSRWRPLGTVLDSLYGKPSLYLANSNNSAISLSYTETAQADANTYVHNSGTLSLRLALVQMDRPDATEDERLLRQLANNGQLRLRLSDNGQYSSQVTYAGAPRVERGGAIYTKAVDAGAVLRQAPASPWSGQLASGTVQWLMPSFFKTQAERSDLSFLSSADTVKRAAGIVENLNPQAPLAVQLALQQLEGRTSNHLSGSQSGGLASAVNGVMRFTHDPIANTAYKSYIGADGRVRIAARSFDGQDWLDVASLDKLQLAANETVAPDLVALGGQVVVASWNSAGALVTYLIDTNAATGSNPIEALPTSVELARQTSAADGDNQWRSASATTKTNRDLQIGLENRLDLSKGSTSLQKAYYLSVLDPIQQVYTTSSQALKLELEGYEAVANAKPLLEAAQGWSDLAASEAQLKALLGFGQKSSQGLFSNKQPGNELATVRSAAFMEYASAEQLASHLAEWGSGSVFTVVGDNEGNAMVWNYDGDAYTRTNADRTKPETVLSSGRIYNLEGLMPQGLSVVYKPTGQKDALISNWAGLVNDKNAEYRQVPGSTLRNADLHERDDLVAGSNVALLVTGTAQNLASKLQSSATAAELGGTLKSTYDYSDGTPILRYFSSERMADSNGVYHWFDAGNIAPLQLNSYGSNGLTPEQQATASLNSGGSTGGLSWIWTSANPLSRGRLEILESNTGLGFVDANSLNLAITGNGWSQQLKEGATLTLQAGSLQLLPSDQTPELFFSSQSSNGTGADPLHLSISAGARSEIGVVLHGGELLNPQRLDEEMALTSSGVLKSFFKGERPFLNRGDYVPLAFYKDGEGRTFYGNLKAPVELTSSGGINPQLFTSLKSQAVTPFGFEGAIADYITYGVKQQYGKDVLKLIQNMPATVDSQYFQFTDNNGKPINIGTVIHGPMVPLFGAAAGSDKQVIIRDLTPWSPDQASLTVQGLKDITLGRGEPDPVIVNQMRMVGTYTEAADSLQSFVAYAWNDPILKYGLLDEALPVGPFSDSEAWLTEFRKSYQNIEIPQSIELVNANYPALVNNTLFSPIAADAVVNDYLKLPFKGTGAKDQIVFNNTIGAGLAIKFGLEAWPFNLTLASIKIPFFKPKTWSVKISSLTGGPLMGTFNVSLDENRNLATDQGELVKTINQAFYQFDVSSRIEQILLDTSEASNTVWDGSKYSVISQNGIPDFRSALVYTKAASQNSAVDVMTGLANHSTYISRADLSIADTHWESVRNSALLDYIPYSFVTNSSVSTSRWFDPINADNNRTSLSKLVPASLETGFKTALKLPASLANNFNNVLRVYDALARAAADPTTAQPDLLQQYSFENRVMLLTGLMHRIYQQLDIQRDQLCSPNKQGGYEAEIYAYQLLPYLALTIAGQTDGYYKTLLKLVAQGVGTASYASAVSDGLDSGTFTIDLNNASDLALVLGFAVLTMPHKGLGALAFKDGRLDIQGRDTEIKGLLQSLDLSDRASELKAYMDAVDGIAAKQYDSNAYLVTTAVSEVKTELLKSGGVLDSLATAISSKQSESGIADAPSVAAFAPLTPEDFASINRGIVLRSSTTAVAPAIAGLNKAQNVEQAFGQSNTSRYEFILRLSQPAPSGGAVFLLNYDGAAEYGKDYKIEGYSKQPQYIHIDSGETTRSLTIDVAAAERPSALLIELASGSANYSISNSFNRLLLEIDSNQNGGYATLREQTDNVQLIGSNSVNTLFGENLFAAPSQSSQDKVVRTIGTQPALSESHVLVSRYMSSLDPKIVKLASTTPSNSEISGEWVLVEKDIFRAYSSDAGLVDVSECRDPKSGQYTYVIGSNERQQLIATGWVDHGVVFSIDANRSLPVGITSNSQPDAGIAVPGLSLQGLNGYFDRYRFAEGQDINEWRMQAAIDNLSFSLGDQNFSLGGSLNLRERVEYGDRTLWLKANVDNFKLPTLSDSSKEPVVLDDAELSFRIFDPAGNGDSDAVINQWQVFGEVSALPVGPFVLNGSINARYENSANTRYAPTYRISAQVKDFDFKVGALTLQDLDVKLTDLTLINNTVTAWTIDTKVNGLQLVDNLRLSGDLNLGYSLKDGTNKLSGLADVSNFDVRIADSSLAIDKGKIGFAVVDGQLQSWNLQADVNNLAFAGLLTLSGSAAISYEQSPQGSTVKGEITLSDAKVALSDDLKLQLDSGSINFEVNNQKLSRFTAQAKLQDAELGLFTLSSATAIVDYKKSLSGKVETERTSVKISDADINLNLGSAIPQQQINDASLSLDIENKKILGFALEAESVQLNLGSGISVEGSFNLVRDTLTGSKGDTTKTYGSIEADSINVDLPGIKFQADGFANFTLNNDVLSSVNLFAQVEGLKLGTGSNIFNIDGFVDLRLSEFTQNAPGKIVLSGGIDDVSLGLPGGNGASLSGEVKELTLTPQKDGNGQLTGAYSATGWELFGELSNFSVGGLFSADGYARLTYAKDAKDNSENLKGKADISDFSLKLPGNSELQKAKINGSASFDLDYQANGANELNWFELTGGVKQLKLASGIEISGELALEYQDQSYSKNKLGQSLYIVNAGFNDSEFKVSEAINLTLDEGRLSDLTIGNDGTIYSWGLKTKVSNLNLYGLSLSGNLDLDYERDGQKLNGSATVSDFSIDLNGDGKADLPAMAGEFGFELIDNKLSSWSLKASADNINLFNTFVFNGSLAVEAKLSATEGDTYTVSAGVKNFAIDFGNNNRAVLNGELRNLVILDKKDGRPFEKMLQSYSLHATNASLNFGTFSVEGAAEIDYGYNAEKKRQTTISAEVKEFKLPSALNAASAVLKGSIKATLVDTHGTGSPELTAWALQASVKDLSLAGLNLNGSLKLSYSEVDQGALKRVPYYQVEADFKNLVLSLPGGRNLTLDRGQLDVAFFAPSQSGAGSSALAAPDRLKIEAKVNKFAITDQLTLSGAISIAYAKDIYRINGNINGLSLPTGQSGQTFGGSINDLTITSNGEVLAWKANAFLEDVVLFGQTTISGQAEIAYTKYNSNEQYTVSAVVDSFNFAVSELDVNVELSGSISLTILNGKLERWFIAANLEGLKVLEFDLAGDLNISYDVRDKLYFNQETLRLARASVSADVFGGLVSADVEVTNLLIVNRDPWTPISWNAKAEVSLGDKENSSLPFALSGNLSIGYQHQNSKYNNLSTYTLAGELEGFHFNGSFLSAGSVDLDLESLILAEGQIRAMELGGSIENLKISDLLDLSGNLKLKYFSETNQSSSSTLSIEGDVTALKFGNDGRFDLYKLLGIQTAGIKSTIKNGSDIEFTADVSLQPDFKFNVAGLSFGFEKANGTIRYMSSSNELVLDVSGRLSIGGANTFPVEGSFSTSVDLDDGSFALRNASLLLTPDNQPVDFGLVRLNPGTQLNFSNNIFSVDANLSVNSGLLNAAAAPVYNFINTISPAVKPVVNTLSAKIPLYDFKTNAVDITIPAIKIPEVFISGYKRLFGINVPQFSTRLKTIIPEQRTEILPKMNLGQLATSYFEDYYGNPYKGNSSLETIEIIDKVGSEIFKVNQLLARFGVSGGFEPYLALYGKAALAMPYPALSPFVKSVESLLKLAESGGSSNNNSWADLPTLKLIYDVSKNKFDFKAAGGNSALMPLIDSLGGFGELYTLVNNNPNVAPNMPKPIASGLSGFVDRSSLSVPILDNPAKALFDFILDKNIDVFEFNLDMAAGLQTRAEISIPPEATTAVIGIPLPITIGGNFGVTAGIDATLGFSAPTKGIKAIANEVGKALSGGGIDVQQMVKLLFNASTEANSGAYLKLADELVSLDVSSSVDLGLDYRVTGIRGQVGFGTSLFGGLSLNGSKQDYERLYLNNLLRSIFEPDFGVGRTAADLNLGLKLGNTRVWTDLQLKAVTNWLSLLRLELPIPMPKTGLKFKLGTIYTGPTFGTNEVFFDQNLDFNLNNNEARVFSEFRNGSADQDELFSRISAQLLENDLSGLLIVEPSADARDVMTGLSRELALFDAITPSDRIPDALSVISSLQAVPLLLQHHFQPSPASPQAVLNDNYLRGIAGFDELSIGAASSYIGLEDPDPEVRSLALKQLQMEYQLQSLLLATGDALQTFGIQQLNLASSYPTLPQSDGLNVYLPLALYAQQQQFLQQSNNRVPFLDLGNAASLKQYFTFLADLISSSDTSLADQRETVSAAMDLLAHLVANLNRQIVTVSSATAELTGLSHGPALALVGLKQIMQGGSFADLLKSLQGDSVDAAAITALFDRLLQTPRSAQNGLSFADAGWVTKAQGDTTTCSVALNHPASDLGANLSLIVSSQLTYGSDFTINGLTNLPGALEILSGEQELQLSVERLSEKAKTAGAGDISLILLQGHSGIQINQAANTLTVAANGSATVAATELSAAALTRLAGVVLIQADADGVFAVHADNSGRQQLLLGFDPQHGHRLTWTGSGAVPALQLVNGTLYAGSQAIAQVLSPKPGGQGWQPLSYVPTSVLLGTSSVQSAPTALLTISEDTPLQASFNTLLGVSDPFTVLAVTGDGNLQLNRDGNRSDNTLSITPSADFNGTSEVLITIDQASTQRTLRLPINVTAVADAPRQIKPLELSTDEDTPLTIDLATLASAFLDRDRFELVKFVSLQQAKTQDARRITIDIDANRQQLTLTPAADVNGEVPLVLTVEAASGSYSFDLKLSVNPVDDQPTGNTKPVLISNTSAMALTAAAFNPVDRDGPSFDPSRDGIRILTSPFAGTLLWKATRETPASEAKPLNLMALRLITLNQLNAGQLLYRPDGNTVDGALVTDHLQYAIVQTTDQTTLISDPQVLVLADQSKQDLQQPAEQDVALSEGSGNQPQPPTISDFKVVEGEDQLLFNMSFDQALTPEGGFLRLIVTNDPSDWSSGELVASLSLGDPGVVLAADRKSLALTLATNGNHLLQGREGYLVVDLVSQGDALKNAAGLSLVGNPSFYTAKIDFKGPQLLGHSFITSGSSVLLQLNFSEAVTIAANTTVKLSSIHAITGERKELAVLPVRDTAGPELLVDLSPLVANLTMLPGSFYEVSLDEQAGPIDLGPGNKAAGAISERFELPFPSSSLYKEARENALTLPATDLHLGFGLQNQNGELLPTELLSLGKIDSALANKPATLARHENQLISNQPYLLSLQLFDNANSPSAVQKAAIDWSKITGAEAILRYNRSEFWIDPINQPMGQHLLELSTIASDPTTNLVDLKLRFGPSATGWDAINGGIALGQLQITPIPNGSAADLADSYPSVLVHSISLDQANASQNSMTISLPQLVIDKDNTFGQQASNAPLLLSSAWARLAEGQSDITGLLETRSVHGLSLEEGLSISTQPRFGKASLDIVNQQWRYSRDPGNTGMDEFTISVVDEEDVVSQKTIRIFDSSDLNNDGAVDGFEAGKDINNDGIDDSLQRFVAAFQTSTGSPGAISINQNENLINDSKTGTNLAQKVSLLFKGIKGKAESLVGEVTSKLKSSITIHATDGKTQAPDNLVLATSDQPSFAIVPEVNAINSIDLATESQIREAYTTRFSNTIQTVDLYFGEGAQNWNAMFKPDGKGGYFLFNFNPQTGLGGVLVDRDNNGNVDGARLYLKDGELGDFDRSRNGVIDDPIGLASLAINPTVQISADGLGLVVDGVAGSGLWLTFEVQSSQASWQNNLELITRDGMQLGSVGATPESSNMGRKSVYVAAGQELRFAQSSGHNPTNSAPNIQLNSSTTGFRLRLDDGGSNDADFNDLDVTISPGLTAPDTSVIGMGRLQRSGSDALIDLTDLPSTGSRINLSISTNSGFINQFSLVKVDGDPLTGYSVAGVRAENSEVFRKAVRANLINPWGSSINIGGTNEQTITWDANGNDAGIYAPVIITPKQDLFTFGATASDGNKHLKVIGDNKFGFEDLIGSAPSDWDYNDLVVHVS